MDVRNQTFQKVVTGQRERSKKAQPSKKDQAI